MSKLNKRYIPNSDTPFTGTITGDKSAELNMKCNEAVDGLALTESAKSSTCTANDMKFDQDKPIAGALKDFDLALIELSKLLTLGAKKYKRSSWMSVPNAEQRYYDGIWRHLLEYDDVEGDLGHDVAVVFNALVVLQLRLMKESGICRGCGCHLSENDTTSCLACGIEL